MRRFTPVLLIVVAMAFGFFLGNKVSGSEAAAPAIVGMGIVQPWGGIQEVPAMYVVMSDGRVFSRRMAQHPGPWIFGMGDVEKEPVSRGNFWGYGGEPPAKDK